MEFLLSVSSGEGDILIWIQDNLRQEWLTPIMKFITSLGNAGIFWIILTIVLLCFKKTRKAGIMSAMALVFSLLINNCLLKPTIARTRPYVAISDLKCIVKPEKDFSFPSGHTGASFASGFTLLRNLPKKAGIPLFILAFLIAFSRLYVGVHYPTDVLGGMVTGITCGILACCLYPLVEKKVISKKLSNTTKA